ncbi:hypothetical protein GCM10027344_26610 [Spelaeicoccus albus]
MLRICTIFAAALIDAGIWFAAVRVGDVQLVYAAGPETTAIGIASVVAAVVVTGALAWGLLAALGKITRHAAAVWTTIAVAVTAVSLISPLTTAQNRPAMTILVCMHVAAAVVVITGFRISASRTEGRRESRRRAHAVEAASS